MTKYKLILYSKDKKAINYFLKFLENITKTQNIKIVKKLLKKKKTKKKLSILKSPHVNKTAQEQFEYVHYFITISFYSWEIKKYFILLKKIKNQLFPDIRIQLKAKISHSKKNKLINLNKTLFYKPVIANKNKKQKDLTLPQLSFSKNRLNNLILHLKILDFYGKL